jgi:hypothetical protein
MYEKGGLGRCDGSQAAATKGVEFFLVRVVFIVIVGDLFLQEPVVCEVEGL